MLPVAEAALRVVPLWGRGCGQSSIGVPNNHHENDACWKWALQKFVTDNLVSIWPFTSHLNPCVRISGQMKVWFVWELDGYTSSPMEMVDTGIWVWDLYMRKWFELRRNLACRVNLGFLVVLLKRLPFKTLFAPPVGSSRKRRPSRFLECLGTGRTSAVSALMELNLAAPKLQGGVLRSAITSPQTSQRVQGPTCPLSSTEMSPTSLSGSLGRSKYL